MIDPAGCRAQIGELAKRILDEAGDEHTPDSGVKPVGTAQPLAHAPIAAPTPDTRAGGASNGHCGRDSTDRTFLGAESLLGD
jgi:hypothetical protein